MLSPKDHILLELLYAGGVAGGLTNCDGTSRDRLTEAALDYARSQGWSPPKPHTPRLAWARCQDGGYIARICGLVYRIERLGVEWSVLRRPDQALAADWVSVGFDRKLATAKQRALLDASAQVRL